MVYMGGRSSIPNHVFSKSTTYVNKRSLRLQRRGFGIAPSGAKFKGTYVKQLKRERRGFGGGITRGRPNALASNRHNQGIGRERRFKFLFPGHPKYYRGNRSKLGLFKMK
jgi:hypothetical protein